MGWGWVLWLKMDSSRRIRVLAKASATPAASILPAKRARSPVGGNATKRVRILSREIAQQTGGTPAASSRKRVLSRGDHPVAARLRRDMSEKAVTLEELARH